MSCVCGWEEHGVPATRSEIIEAGRTRDALQTLTEPVAVDASRWMSVLRCTTCGCYWAEDNLESGHATLLFAYPIETVHPQAWLDAAEHVWA